MAIINQVFKTIMGGTDKKPSLDGVLAIFDRELENFQHLVQPDPTSKPRTPFDSPHLTFDQMYMSRLTLRQILEFLPVMIPLRVRMSQSARLYDGKFQAKHSEATPEFYLHSKTWRGWRARRIFATSKCLAMPFFNTRASRMSMQWLSRLRWTRKNYPMPRALLR